MVKDHLILRAPLLVAAAKDHNLALKHTQALDLLASMIGRRDWREVCAFEYLLAGYRPTLQGYERLSGRILKKHAVQIDVARLIQALEEHVEVGSAKLWPDGPAPGLYFTESDEDEKRAIDIYCQQTGMPYYFAAEYAQAPTENGIEIGANLASAGLRKLPSGTLIVVRIEQPSEYNWDEESSWSLRIACSLALDPGHRVIVRMDSHLAGDTIRNAALLTGSDRSLDPDDDGRWHRLAFKGILTEKGFKELPLLDMWRLMSPQATPAKRREISPAFKLPKAAADALSDVGRRKLMGHVFVGLDEPSRRHENRRNHDYSNQALETVLHAIDPSRPCALVCESWRHQVHKPERPGLEDLPVFPSVHSAVDAGFDMVVVMKPCSPREGMQLYRNNCLVVTYHWGALAGQVATASLLARMYPLDSIAAVVALAISLSDQLDGRIPAADVYLSTSKTGLTLDSGRLGVYVHEHRTANVLSQVQAHLLANGQDYTPPVLEYDRYPPQIRDLYTAMG